MSALKKLPYYDASKVRENASGRWLEILGYLAYDQLGAAIQKPKKHHTCPIHGTSSANGKGDGFKFYNDVVETGGGVCNSCGAFHDGFKLLQEVKGWNFRDTLANVAEYLRVPSESDLYKSATQSPSPQKLPASVPSAEGTQSDVVSIATNLKEQEEPKSFAATPERMLEIKAIQERLAKKQAVDSKEAQERIDRTWRESIPLNNGIPKPLFKYFESRGILLRIEALLKGDNIRFHRELPYYEEDDAGKMCLVGKYPAMIAAIRNLDGKIMTLHRTYLTKTGKKAKVECPRKMMTVPDNKKVTGAAIQLGGLPQDGVLGVAEGYETAASPMRVYGIPTWSCVSASILEMFEPPKGVHTIIGWEDKDRSLRGEIAMQILKDRLTEKGIRFIRMPIRRAIPASRKSIDWNDVLVQEGIIGMPVYKQLMKVIKEG